MARFIMFTNTRGNHDMREMDADEPMPAGYELIGESGDMAMWGPSALARASRELLSRTSITDVRPDGSMTLEFGRDEKAKA